MELRIHGVSLLPTVENAPCDAIVLFNLYCLVFFGFQCFFLLNEFWSSLVRLTMHCEGNRINRSGLSLRDGLDKSAGFNFLQQRIVDKGFWIGSFGLWIIFFHETKHRLHSS